MTSLIVSAGWVLALSDRKDPAFVVPERTIGLLHCDFNVGG